jgi:hypothetical protein
MVIVLRKNEVQGRSVLKKINIEGEVREGQEVIVRYETCTVKWKGFESQIVIWTKIYERF